MFVIAPLVGLAATFLLLGMLLRWPALLPIRDIPNDRSLHTKTIPRIGGIAVTAGVTAACVFLRQQPSLVDVLPVVIVVVISLVDDIRGVPAKWRLLAHLSAAAIFVLGHLQLTFLFAIPFVLAIVWMTNLYNFMDGSDGLAGGMALIGFSVYSVAAFLAHHGDLALVSASIACSAGAFLFFNFHPAKVFLGDVGSIPLGFAAGSLGLLGWNRNIWPLWFPFLVFSPFIVDATLTLVKRISRSEKVWEGHRDHYYQRLVRMGWGHRRTALAEYALMISVGSSALAALRWTQSMQFILLLIWALVYVGLVFLIERAWRQFQTRH